MSSEKTRNEDNHYTLIKEESVYTFKVENVSRRCKCLCSNKLKSVKFRIILKRNLRFSAMTVFREFLLLYWILQKTNLISFRYLPRPSNWQSMSKIEFSTVATIALIRLYRLLSNSHCHVGL